MLTAKQGGTIHRSIKSPRAESIPIGPNIVRLVQSRWYQGGNPVLWYAINFSYTYMALLYLIIGVGSSRGREIRGAAWFRRSYRERARETIRLTSLN